MLKINLYLCKHTQVNHKCVPTKGAARAAAKKKAKQMEEEARHEHERMEKELKERHEKFEEKMMEEKQELQKEKEKFENQKRIARENDAAAAAPRQHHQQAHYLRQAHPLPLTVAPQDALPEGWDQMAVPLNQLGQAAQPRAARSRGETLQALEGAAAPAAAATPRFPVGDARNGGLDGEEKKYGELTPTAGWPHDLPGATGDDSSWIVGMHREPLWTDSMTRACGLTDPCPTGRADRGHGMQMDRNPFDDKRRTFDPYAYGDAYADAETRKGTPGRMSYPWDPTRDAQFYGKEGAQDSSHPGQMPDCSDGDLKDECYERPQLDDLRKKQAVWMKKYDEFSAPKPGVEEEKEEEKAKQAANNGAPATEAVMKKDGLDGALLHLGFGERREKAGEPEVTPWARSIKTGMLAASVAVKDTANEAAAVVTATAKEAAADAQTKMNEAHFVGGEAVLGSLGKVVDKVKTAYKEGTGFFSEHNLSELERKFLRARHSRQQQELAKHQALRAFDSSVLGPVKSSTTALAAISTPVAKSNDAKSASRGNAKGRSGNDADATIWESPAQVAVHGVYGSAQARDSQREKGKEKQRALASKVMAAVNAQSKGQEGPLPPVGAEAIKIAHEAEEDAETLLKKVTGREASPWVQANIQKGVLQKQSTSSNLLQLVKEHDEKLLKEASGLTAEDLKSALASADRDSNLLNKGIKGVQKTTAGKALEPWEQKVVQQGTLRHQTVEQNLKAALDARENMLLKDKTGWKSMQDMRQAETFADNLEREIKMRHREESKHPLIPSGAKSLLTTEGQQDGAKPRSASPHQSDDEVNAKAKEAMEQRELDKLRESEPLVKALQAEVENDDQELTEEAQQQRLTLKQLHRDQQKLNAQLTIEENVSASPTQVISKGHTHKSAHKAKSITISLHSAKAREGTDNRAHEHETPPKHGFSDMRAKDDLDEYFAKQEVGGDLSHPASTRGAGATPAHLKSQM